MIRLMQLESFRRTLLLVCKSRPHVAIPVQRIPYLCPLTAHSNIQHITEDRKITPQLTVRVYTPTVGHADTHPLPVGLYFHGGGLCCGDLDSEDTFCRQVAERLPCVIVSVGYRLAPEYKAPAQLDDAVEAWNWVGYNVYHRKDKERLNSLGLYERGCLERRS